MYERSRSAKPTDITAFGRDWGVSRFDSPRFLAFLVCILDAGVRSPMLLMRSEWRSVSKMHNENTARISRKNEYQLEHIGFLKPFSFNSKWQYPINSKLN